MQKISVLLSLLFRKTKVFFVFGSTKELHRKLLGNTTVFHTLSFEN